jgi:hypothetical protein
MFKFALLESVEKRIRSGSAALLRRRKIHLQVESDFIDSFATLASRLRSRFGLNSLSSAEEIEKALPLQAFRDSIIRHTAPAGATAAEQIQFECWEPIRPIMSFA